MSTPVISVIVPIYNIEDYLERCVRSIMNQSYRELEILLIDDGSTDGTAVLCDQLAALDDRVRVFHKENGGSSSARNLGLEMATGEYIGFVDSDDYIAEDMYEKLLGVILERKLLVAQISRDEIDENGEKRADVCIPPEAFRLCDNRTFLKELLLHQGDCSFCTKLFHKSLLANRRFPIGELNEDFKLFVSMLPEVPAIGILPDYGYHVFYRVGSNTRTVNRDVFSPVFVDIVKNADWVMELVKRDFPELSDYGYRFGFFQRLDYMLHIPVKQMNRDNEFYCNVKNYLRKHVAAMIRNPYLSKKNKIYLGLLTIAPKTVRSLHQKWMDIR